MLPIKNGDFPYITMENHHFLWVSQLWKMAIFNSKLLASFDPVVFHVMQTSGSFSDTNWSPTFKGAGPEKDVGFPHWILCYIYIYIPCGKLSLYVYLYIYVYTPIFGKPLDMLNPHRFPSHLLIFPLETLISDRSPRHKKREPSLWRKQPVVSW